MPPIRGQNRELPAAELREGRRLTVQRAMVWDSKLQTLWGTTVVF